MREISSPRADDDEGTRKHTHTHTHANQVHVRLVAAGLSLFPAAATVFMCVAVRWGASHGVWALFDVEYGCRRVDPKKRSDLGPNTVGL